ncbi:YdbC family protein [Pseudalkalibacillus hwajinpoensis]|nr:YdbC family protein [Pseudalkalibacillus hwajinpoensis]
MLIKNVICEVKEGHASSFSSGQERWKELKHCNGFIAQFGGWSQNKRTATIIGFWLNRSSYNEFMKKYHDVIYEKTGQSGTFDSIHVVLEENEVEKINKVTSEWLRNQFSTFCEKWTITRDQNEGRVQ